MLDHNLADLVDKYGFAVIAVVGMGYFVFYIWQWVTKEIKPTLNAANLSLIKLIDRIRVLDNDLIRLDQKVQTVLQLRGEKIARETERAKEEINRNGHD